MEKDKTRWFLIIDYYWLLLCRARARCPLPPSSSPPGGPKDRSILKSIQKHPASRSILKSSSKGSRVAKWPQIERTEAFYTVNEPLNHGLSDPGFEGVMVGDASERPEASSIEGVVVGGASERPGASWNVLEHPRASWSILERLGAPQSVLERPRASGNILEHPGASGSLQRTTPRFVVYDC